MDQQNKERFLQALLPFIAMVSRSLPPDVYERLKELERDEQTPLQKAVYGSYFKNLSLAGEQKKPCCQDTGLLHFYIKAGARFPYLDELGSWLRECTARATEQIPLRPNTVDFFTGSHSEQGLGERIPWLNWEIVPSSDRVEITTYFAGGGCCLPGQARVFTPSQGYPAIAELVFDVVTGLGVNACPPVIVGIGLGENIENAAVLSKKAYFRPVGSRHPDPKAAEMERILLEGINSLGLGAQGLPGKNYALDVHIESSGRHTATMAAAVNLSCYVHRCGVIEFDRDLRSRIVNYRSEGNE